MEGDIWKGRVKKPNFPIFKRITPIPTHTIWDGRITRISDEEINKIQVLIKVFNKSNKLQSKGRFHNWKRPCKTSLRPFRVVSIR